MLMLIRDAVRLVLKSQQLPLFDMPVHVAASVDKRGRVRAPHMATRKKRLEVSTPPAQQHRGQTRLDGFIASHGGVDHMRQSLEGMTAEQRAKLIDAMAHVGQISHAEVMTKLGMREPEPPAVEPPPEAGPREGDTKTEDGVEYVFRESRWHRVEPELPRADPTADLPEIPRPDTEIAEAREDLADEMARNPHSDRARELMHGIAEQEVAVAEPHVAPAEAAEIGDSDHHPALESLRSKIAELGGREAVASALRANNEKSDSLIHALAESMGLDYDTVAAELGLNRLEAAAPVADDNDPSSPNYRYRDTGYVAGSRKEMASAQIRTAAKNGQRLRATDIDWSEIEKNPREAEQLITKSNLFGEVDWDALKAGGMEPGAGFLVDRVYASVGSQPANSADARKYFALGLETLRDRMERCHTPEQVTAVLQEIKDEIAGEMLNASESEEYRVAYAAYQTAFEEGRLMKDRHDSLSKEWQKLQNQQRNAEWEQEKRTRRGWKPDPEIGARIVALKDATEVAHAAAMKFEEENPDIKSVRREIPGGWTAFDNAYEWRSRELRDNASAIKQRAQQRNIMENPLTRAWVTLGEKFLAVAHWRSHKGSEAFAGHVTSAKNGKIKDWSWVERKTTAAPRSTKSEVQFQLKVAEKFTRTGGRPVTVDSTEQLKSKFGLREVQSGNWVLKDVNSATFHVQHAAEALSDMADILGIPDEHIAVNGRLALAFGARGRGNAGFAGAARAHYEPVHRVVNLTKMGGGGTLAHEVFHAIDNLIKEAEGGGAGDAGEYASENPDLVPHGEVRDAFRALNTAITSGGINITETFLYTDREHRTAVHNIDHPNNEVSRGIKGAPSAAAAVQFVRNHYASRYRLTGDESKAQKRLRKQRDTWISLAVAYHDGNSAGNKVSLPTGAPVSSFAFEATVLDAGSKGKYWSSTREMSARAFQSYCEDKLAAQGRRNDYLSAFADNKFYLDPLFGQQKPFPEGEERTRINIAFDRLFAVMAQRRSLAKALEVMS